MKPSWRFAAPILLGLSLPSSGQVASSPDRQEIVHVLNRITFGPRPGDIEAVEKMGLQNYIEQQLHPETLDDSAVEKALRQYPLLQMTSEQLETTYREEKKAGKATKRDKAHPEMADADAPAPGKKEHDPQGVVKHQISGVIGQLEDAKLIRAAYSTHQLQEVLVDFWTNHFNIDVKKKDCSFLNVAEDQDVIRPHIWGSFHDLLEATAKSPAMLFYLDNWQNSVAPPAPPKTAQPTVMAAMAPQKKKAKKDLANGINENYAREIMELHTLGLDGGYTQKDVQEVARCFTGWTIDKKTAGFVFLPEKHDNGVKIVLGHVIPANGGIKDGETVLSILASSPATAHFISRELCQRFVSDNPPEALVTRVAQVFQQTDGDLRRVTETILTSPEFLSPASFQTKIKSPLEFAVSAVRATQSTLVADSPGLDRKEGQAVKGKTKETELLSTSARQSLNWHVYELGEPLFACTPPTGYQEVSKIWVNTGALVERLNFAMALTQQRVQDVNFNAGNIVTHVDVDRPQAVLDQCVSVLLPGTVSAGTLAVLDRAALPTSGQNGPVDPSKLIALILGSPEFQRK